jgi:His/Glu/Gln/Arg/opine family amino acid ABC transporter permease subunit
MLHDFRLRLYPQHPAGFFKAVGVTLQVGLIAIGTSLLVALLNATILVFRTPYLRAVGLYVELARNTPLLIQLFFVYFALPALGIKVSGFTAAIITMTFWAVPTSPRYCAPASMRCRRRNWSRGAPSACPTASCCAT